MDFILPQAAKTQERALTVSEVTDFVRGAIEGEPKLQGVWVRGETSNVHPASTGHLYFTLKDEDSELTCVFFGYSRQRKKPLEDGTAVLAFGNISVYARRGSYQLVVSDIIPQGEGELAARFEQLKRQLAEEGLFAPEHKALPPEMPRTVGVVTSPQAAAFTDVVNVLTRRAPYLHVVLFPTAVQGDAAAEQIIQALKQADASGVCEAILLVRGGGSLEDLWCFNDERVARAVAASRIPVISGVGHEIDFTLADFAADLRAPTPSAAAELATPVTIDDRATAVLENRRLLSVYLLDIVSENRRRLDRLAYTLQYLSPRARVESARQTVDQLAGRSGIAVQRLLELQRAKVAGIRRALDAISPLRTLSRGYAIVSDEAGQVIDDAGSVLTGDQIAIRLYRGRLRAEVIKQEVEDE